MPRNKKLWWTGGLAVALLALAALALPTGSAAERHEQGQMMGENNHFKCYEALDWGNWRPSKAELKDQFGRSVAYVVRPKTLCNPVDKNGEGMPNPEYHLVCYEIKDDPLGEHERIKKVEVHDQFYEGPLYVGMANLLCVPAKKHYEGRG
ncbi:MAG: hypothetical protein ACE5GX_15615 [Thermoanaerobaculia bacterium]